MATHLNRTVTLGPDFDLDGISDLVVYRPSTGTFHVRKSSLGYQDGFTFGLGNPGDIPLLGDFDRDGISDLVVYRPTTGAFHVRKSSLGYEDGFAFGLGDPGDVPLLGDFDRDGISDLVVYRPTTGAFHVRKSSLGYEDGFAFGLGDPGDVPLLGDFDRDGISDLVVFRPSTGVFHVRKSSLAYQDGFTFSFGNPGDIPLLGDFDQDGISDFVVYRPCEGTFYTRSSSSGYREEAPSFPRSFLSAGGIPLLADVDGDGKSDLLLYSVRNGAYYTRTSSSQYQNEAPHFPKGLGNAGDLASSGAAPCIAAPCFVIGAWGGPLPQFYSDATFQQARDAGLNLIMAMNGLHGSYDLHVFKQYLAGIQRAGLMGAAFNSNEILDDVKSGRVTLPLNFTGFAVCDDTPTKKTDHTAYDAKIPGAQSLITRIRSEDPLRLCWNSLSFMFADIEPYVTDCLNELATDVVAIEDYHPDTAEHRASFLDYVNRTGRLCAAAGRSFWTILCLTYDPSEDFLLWQATQAIRAGSRGILYFMYSHWPETSELSLVDNDGNPTELYWRVKATNAKLWPLIYQQAK